MPDPSSTHTRAQPGPENAIRIASQNLFRGASLVEIEHRGEIYRLQVTRQGKLILTK